MNHRHAAGHGLGLDPDEGPLTLKELGERPFTIVKAGRHYRMDVPAKLLAFEIADLKWSGAELIGELTVTTDTLGTAAVDGCLSRANFKVTDAGTRDQRARLLSERARDPTIPFDLLLEALCQAVLVDARRPDESPAKGLKGIKETIECFRASLGDEGHRLSFGVPILDRATRGVAPGELLTILARTDSWKTMFILNLLGSWSARYPGFAWVLAELEMRRDQVLGRLARQHFGLPGPAVDTGFLRGSLDIGGFESKFQHLHIVDEGAVSLERITAYATQLERDSPVPVAAVFVDHAGLIRSRGGTAYERATETAIGLKQMARQLDVAVVAIVQANRGASNATDPVALESARDSGAYEENADFCLTFSQKIDSGGRGPFVRAELKKNRRGPGVKLALGFDPQTLRMTEIEEDSRAS